MEWRTKFKSGAGLAGWTVLWLFLLNSGAALGGEPVATPTQSWPAQAVIRFAATSTLHDFGGQLPAQPFALVISNHTWSAEADVLSGLMATANLKRDRNLHAMMNTNTYSFLHGRVTQAPIPGAAGTNVTFTLKIRDQQFDLPARVTNWEETPTEIRFHATSELSLKQYGLKPPSVIGVIRVGDRVQLEADVTATKTPAPTETPILKQ